MRRLLDGPREELERLGREPRRAMRVVVALLVVYAIAFAVFYPQVITVSDEGSYLRQAGLIARGTNSIAKTHPLTGTPIDYRPANYYPLGTALWLTPFVWAYGWQASFLASCLALLAGVFVTARWLAEHGRSPLFASLVLGFLPALVLGRVSMSESPSMALVATGLWLFFRVDSRPGAPTVAWLGAGFAAGVSVLFRESNALLFAPFFIGAVLRRERAWWALAVGGLAGVALRGVSAGLFFDDPFFYKPPAPFRPENLMANAALYGVALLILVPGGLAAALAYRGGRRPELVATVVVFVLLYGVYDYSGAQSALWKQLVIGPRFFVPLLPLLAWAAAETFPRWWRSLLARRPARAPALTHFGALAVGLWLAGVAASAVGVQWAHHAWGEAQARIRDAIYEHTPEDSVVVTNWLATGKFIDLLYGDRFPIKREHLSRWQVAALAQRQPIYVVFLDRSDSRFWIQNAEQNRSWVMALDPPPELELDLQATPTDRLRIWRVSRRLPSG